MNSTKLCVEGCYLQQRQRCELCEQGHIKKATEFGICAFSKFRIICFVWRCLNSRSLAGCMPGNIIYFLHLSLTPSLPSRPFVSRIQFIQLSIATQCCWCQTQLNSFSFLTFLILTFLLAKCLPVFCISCGWSLLCWQINLVSTS